MNYLFLILLIGSTGYALVAGGLPERIGAVAYAVSCQATYSILLRHAAVGWVRVETGVLVVDITIFLFFVVLALRSDRFWPIWASALLGLGVLGHVARWSAGSAILTYAYAVSLTIWSYPIMAAIAVGTWHYQRRFGRFGYDRSRTPSGPAAQAEDSACT